MEQDATALHHELHRKRGEQQNLNPDQMVSARLIAFTDKTIAAEIYVAIQELRNEWASVDALYQKQLIDFHAYTETSRLVTLVNQIYKACDYFRNMKPESMNVGDSQQELDDMCKALKVCQKLKASWNWNSCTAKTREIADKFIILAEFAQSIKTPTEARFDDNQIAANYNFYIREKAEAQQLHDSKWWESETPMGILLTVGLVPPLERFWICPIPIIMQAAEAVLGREVFRFEINKPDDVLDLINEAKSKSRQGLEQIMKEAGCSLLITPLEGEPIEHVKEVLRKLEVNNVS